MRLLPLIASAALLLLPSRTTFAGDPAAHPSLPPRGSLEGLGVNIHFTDPQPGEMEMIEAAGFKWVRMDFSWAGTERQKGAYNFSAYDHLVAALEQRKMRALFILDYGNPLYGKGEEPPRAPEAQSAFVKWAVAAVSHFRGRGFVWEMWNEPNIAQFWKPKPAVEEYIALAKATGAGLREAGLCPANSAGEAFIGPASSTMDFAFLEHCLQAGLLEYWCAVSVHPYRQTKPHTVAEDYAKLRSLIGKYGPSGKDIPIISSEWGYSSAWEKVSEEEQKQDLIEEFRANIANGIPLSIWYDWRDDGDDPKEPEHHFGLVYREYHPGGAPVYKPKPAYEGMQSLVSRPLGKE